MHSFAISTMLLMLIACSSVAIADETVHSHNHHDHDDHHHEHRNVPIGEKQDVDHHHHHHDDGVPQADAPSPALTGLKSEGDSFSTTFQTTLKNILPTSVWGRAFAGTAFITIAGNAVILIFLFFDVSPQSLNFLVVSKEIFLKAQLFSIL